MKFQSNIIMISKSVVSKTTLCFILILAACSKFESKQPQSPNVDRVNEYQIGAEWNRTPLSSEHWSTNQVFRLYRLYQSDVGVGVYLGAFKGKHLMLTVNHNFPDLEQCDEDINFIVYKKTESFYYYCNQIIHRFIENDALIFSFTSDNLIALSHLEPVLLNKQNLTPKDQLKLITARRDNIVNFQTQHYSDRGKDCRILSPEIKFLADLDETSKTTTQSWSQSVGCDGMHGDSGAPIYNSANEITGLLWTGKHPKDEKSSFINPSEPRLIWENYNYMVPTVKIIEELQVSKQEKTLDESLLTFLKSFEKL